MQVAVVDFAKHVAGIKGASGKEWDADTKYPVIGLMPELMDLEAINGHMRLGLYPCKLKFNTKVMDIYKDEIIYERHRHKYEVNNEYRFELEDKGLIISGASPDDRLVEIIEIEDHPWFVGVIFHPEFKSRPTKAHPLFREFIKASMKKEEQ